MSLSINMTEIVELRLTVPTGENHFKAQFAQSLKAYPHAIQGRIVKENETTTVAIHGYQADLVLVASSVVRLYPGTAVEYGRLTDLTDFRAVIIEKSRPNTTQGSSGEIAHALPTGPAPPPYTFTDCVRSFPRAARKVIPGKESAVLAAVAAAGADVTTSAANLGAAVFVNRKETVSVLKRWWKGQDEFDEKKVLAEWRAWGAARTTMGESTKLKWLELEFEEKKLELEWKKEANKMELEWKKEANKMELERKKLELEEKKEANKMELEWKKLDLEERKVRIQESELEFRRVQADKDRELESTFAAIRQFPPRPRSL